ncbi:HIT family protein [Saccharobesus litoralis]|uniref:HIT family protein n=1 Tax=Saccharobesus litoralis TaxID=2172099 RepID=A0A2S0VWZ1_9ALTE|nr:HIT family protein [Saccharobesus litoralis]AWB68705.1 HIT family protein [Saccharobesus litoralis]
MLKEFSLDPRLQADCFTVAELELSKLLLLDNSQVPWLILVPKVADVAEITDLNPNQQTQLLAEINLVSSVVQDAFSPDKLNVAAIGNVVNQLHVHIIGRYHTDPVWPSPVWGNLQDEPYHEDELAIRLNTIRSALVAS